MHFSFLRFILNDNLYLRPHPLQMIWMVGLSCWLILSWCWNVEDRLCLSLKCYDRHQCSRHYIIKYLQIIPDKVQSLSIYGVQVRICFTFLESYILERSQRFTNFLRIVSILFFAFKLSLICEGVVRSSLFNLVLFVLWVFVYQECLFNLWCFYL